MRVRGGEGEGGVRVRVGLGLGLGLDGERLPPRIAPTAPPARAARALGVREARSLASVARAHVLRASRSARHTRPAAPHDALEVLTRCTVGACACGHPCVALIDPEERRLIDVQLVLDPAVCKQHLAHRGCWWPPGMWKTLSSVSQQPRGGHRREAAASAVHEAR